MAQFEYQGVDRSGKRVSGTIEVESEGQLRVELRQQGIRPTRIARKGGLSAVVPKAAAPLLKRGGAGASLNLKQKILFTRQLEVMLSSGIPLVQALEILSDQTDDPVIKRIMLQVSDHVSQGGFFWESLSFYPKAFSKVYVSLVRAGESSGSLDVVLKRLVTYLEDEERLRRMVIGALTYPAVVSVVGVAIICVMLVFVIPKFEAMINSSGGEMPGPTALVIAVSHFLTANWLPFFGGVGLAAFLGMRFVATPEGKAVLDRTLYNLPLFGPLIQKGAIAAFTRTLHTLLAAGVNLIDAIDICKNTVDNSIVAEAVGRIRGEVEVGQTLGSVVGGMSVFPKMAVQMIGVGEATGNLEKMLEKIADFYESEVEATVGTIGSLIEPLILVVLGGAVAGMLIAMYLPVFQMAGGA